MSKIKRCISRAFISAIFYILFTSKAIGRGLYAHTNLLAQLWNPNIKTVGFSFLNSWLKMIQSNLLVLIGKALAPDLHCIALFSAVATFITCFFKVWFLQMETNTRRHSYQQYGFLEGDLQFHRSQSLASKEPKLKPFSHFTLCKLSPLLHHSLIGAVNRFFNGFSRTQNWHCGRQRPRMAYVTPLGRHRAGQGNVTPLTWQLEAEQHHQPSGSAHSGSQQNVCIK